MSQPPPRDSQRYGRLMIYGAWILLLAILTAAFNGYLEQQRNPNRNLASRMNDNGLAEVLLEQNNSGHYLAAGSINNIPVTFLLDTGATLISIPARLAHRLNLERGPAMPAHTANGTVRVYSTRLRRVTLGPIELYDVRASINPGMAGDEVLLGMSFMKNLELVQRDNQLILRQNAAPGGDKY